MNKHIHHGRASSMSSISGSFNDSSASSGSPGTSPIISPYDSPGGSPRDSLGNQFSQRMSLQPPGPPKSGNSNTFVHKLYNMVVDNQYQHLIAWNYTGSSFIVCNIMEFSREVLPKHFKHNNFSSFVRQLNMYGFHKVNKSPRGHRTLTENQIWEFSHPKFIKDRPDLLDEIKRKSLETETRRDGGDINSHMAVMQVSHSEMMQQLAHLQKSFTQVVQELAETKEKQNRQQQYLKTMMDFLSQRHGVQIQMPPEFNFQYNGRENGTIQDTDNTPSIFVTSHDILPQSYLMNQAQPHRPPTLTVQTHNLNQNRASLSPGLSPMDHGSPASTYHTALNTPVSPSPSQFMPDDDMTSIYSSQDAFQNPFYSSSQDPNNAIMSNSGGAFTFTVGAQHTG